LLPLSVIVHTKNEAAQIAACLSGLKGWASEVIVADMQSSDRTVEIAGPLADCVLSLPLMEEFDAARNLSAEAAAQPWILMLDADERLTPTVRSTIEQLVHADDPTVSAYQLPFKVVSFGGWIEHAGNWWPSYKSPPLLRAGRFHFSGRVHEPAIVDGQVVRIRPRSDDDAILHFSHRDLSHYFEKLNRYTSLEALKRGAPGSWEAAARGFGEVFAWYYDSTGGKRDGSPGFYLSFGSAVYEALIQLKLMERNGTTGIPPDAATFLELALNAVREAQPSDIKPARALALAIAQLIPGLSVADGPAKAELELGGQPIWIDWVGAPVPATLDVALVTHEGALTVLGGGEVQLFETVRALEPEGIRCSVGIGNVPSVGSLVHVFSLHHSHVRDSLGSRPYVLTPIYWDRAEIAWLAPKLLTMASRAETLSELASAFDALRNQTEALREDGGFTTRLPDSQRALVLEAATLMPNAWCEAEMLRASVGGELPEVKVIPNGVPDTPCPTGAGQEPDGDPFILCAGRLEVNKNQLALIAACRMIGVRLVLVGAEFDSYYAKVCRSIADQSVEFLGQRPRDEVRELMARASVHVLPSFAETPGLANLEAIAQGCPLVCSNRGAEREYFAEDALYCDPLDLGSIAEAIQSAMKLGRGVRPRRAVTWETVGRMTADVYREVSSGHPDRSGDVLRRSK
jgi:glycosyltransferase involved in cell wall biosynthesis